MTVKLMRKLSPSSLVRAYKQHNLTPSSPIFLTTFFSPHRSLAQIQSHREALPEVWFTSSGPSRRSPEECDLRPDGPPPDERTLKLGKTLRILQSRLPSLLASPLPQEILSPHITLHLFPSTHPHLPTVSGRVAYHAALWTAPMAWGRVPIVGNVKLIIISERIIKTSSAIGDEKLIVRWKTCGKTQGKGMGAFYRGIGGGEQVDKITEWLGGDARDDEEFCGLFIFEFDEEGRVLKHVIEHAEEGGNGERRGVVSVTDWLLGKAKGKRGESAGLVLGCVEVGRKDFGRRRGHGI